MIFPQPQLVCSIGFMGRQLILAVCILLTVVTSASHAGMLISSNLSLTNTGNGDVRDSSGEYRGTTLPVNQLLTSQTSGTLSEMLLGYYESNGTTTLSHSISGFRNASGAILAQLGVLTFTVDVNSTYELSGFYNVEDQDDGIGNTTLWVDLLDKTTNTTLLSSTHESQAGTDRRYTLGLGGDLLGSLRGDLFAGHEYEFRFDAYTFGYGVESGSTAATAEGNVTLTVASSISSVPEPSAVALMAFGFLSVLVARFSRK